MRFTNGWLVALTWIAVLVASTGVAAQDATLLTGGRLFDGTGDDLVPNPGILVTGGKIMAVGTDPAAHPDARVVEITADEVVIPGLVDLHAHHNIRVLGMGRIDETRVYPLIYLANGVTTVFPAGEYDPEDMLAMRRLIDRGEQVGPRVLNSGPYFGQGMRRRASIEEVHARVDEWAELGARGFKAKGIGPEHLAALIERAHLHGLPVTAHLGSGFRNSVNPRDAIRMGIDRIEHFLGGDLLPEGRSAYASLAQLTDADLDGPAFQAIVDLFIERGTAFDATITAYGYFGANEDEIYEQWTDESRFFSPKIRAWAAEQSPPQPMEQFVRIYEVKQKTVKRFFDAGGTITLGTDHVSDGRYLAGFAAHREMHVLARAGIPPADVLRIATINGARAMRLGDALGTIEPGKLADLVVIRGDPLDDIRRTRDVRLVMKAGRLYESAQLLQEAEGRLGAGTPWDDDPAEASGG